MYLLRNEDRARQLNIFGGIKLPRGIGLTDVDGALDFSGEAFIYFEGKFGKASMPYGQRSFLESAVKSHWKAGHPSALIFYRHQEDTGDVFLSGVTVSSVFCLEPLPNFTFYKDTKYLVPDMQASIADTVWLFYQKFNCK